MKVAMPVMSTPMVQEVVTPDNIAHVVSRWTGIPVDKMLEGERDKLLRMEDELGKWAAGQGDAVQAVSRASAPRACRPSGSEPADRARSSSSARPASARRMLTTAALARFLFDDETAKTQLHGHVGIHGEALGGPADRRAPGYVGYEEGGALTELRSPPALSGRAVRRDREGASRRLQRAPAGPRRRPPDRWPWPHRGLPQHDDHHDLSNLGAEYLTALGENEDSDSVRDQVMDVVKMAFRPEFLNLGGRDHPLPSPARGRKWVRSSISSWRGWASSWSIARSFSTLTRRLCTGWPKRGMIRSMVHRPEARDPEASSGPAGGKSSPATSPTVRPSR